MVCSEVVEIKVGSGTDQKSFLVHEGLLRYYSGYFEAALGGSFAEATSRIVKLDEEEVWIFKRFVFWLYTGKYTPPDDANDDYEAICKLWILGDRRQIPLLANAMVDMLRDEIVRLWTLPLRPHSFEYIYQHTTAESALRRFMIWVLSTTGGTSVVNDSRLREWPADAIFDLFQAIWKLKLDGSSLVNKAALAKTDMCPYHQHEKDVKCSKPAT
jgi:hypothetical protein